MPANAQAAAEIPEANAQAAAEIPEANAQAEIPKAAAEIPEANAQAAAEIPETNAQAEIPEAAAEMPANAQAADKEERRLMKMKISTKVGPRTLSKSSWMTRPPSRRKPM